MSTFEWVMCIVGFALVLFVYAGFDGVITELRAIRKNFDAAD